MANSSGIRVVFVSEFAAESGAPTGQLVSQLVHHLQSLGHRLIFLHCPWIYRPGGLRASRLLNLTMLHFLIIPLTIWHRCLAKIEGNQFKLIVTSSPPLLHWTASVLSFLLRIPASFWLQDAHPEMEARLLEARGYNNLASLLRRIDRKMISRLQNVVVLDHSMTQPILGVLPSEKVYVIPPWGTYMLPAKPFKFNPGEKICLLYAGNYGVAHDLGPLVSHLKKLPQEQLDRLQITFVGMSLSAIEKLKKLFETLKIGTHFLPRFEKRTDLLDLMTNMDFGIVSLSQFHEGLACPSKAFTYLSQGLPILYIGPDGTLGANIVNEGWGITLQSLTAHGLQIPRELIERVGSVYPNPEATSLAGLADAFCRNFNSRKPLLGSAMKQEQT